MICFYQTLFLQCLRKEVEEEVYKSLVNKRLAAGEVTELEIQLRSCNNDELRMLDIIQWMIMTCIDYDNWNHLCLVPLLTQALTTYFDR